MSSVWGYYLRAFINVSRRRRRMVLISFRFDVLTFPIQWHEQKMASCSHLVNINHSTEALPIAGRFGASGGQSNISLGLISTDVRLSSK